MKKNIFIISILILFLGLPSFAISEQGSSIEHQNTFGSIESLEKEMNYFKLPGQSEVASKTYNYVDGEVLYDDGKTTPPLKWLRLSIEHAYKDRKMLKEAQVNEGQIVKKAKKHRKWRELFDEVEFNEDGDVVEDNALANELNSTDKKDKKVKVKKSKEKTVLSESVTQDVVQNKMVMDCQKMEYYPEKNELEAVGGVSIAFPEQAIVIKSNRMTYNQITNLIKLYDKVEIYNGETVSYGDFMQIDLNEENGFIKSPRTEAYNLVINAKEGYVYGDKIIQEQGRINVQTSQRFEFDSAMAFNPIMPLSNFANRSSFIEDTHHKKLNIKVRTIKINSSKGIDKITLDKAVFYRGEKKICRMPRVTFYTNKRRDFVEGNYFEIGSKREFGVMAGPGFVLELPNESVLKFGPTINFKDTVGFGGYAKYRSATNSTFMAYTTAVKDKNKRLIGFGRQKLDDNLYLQYGMNYYMPEWFLGLGSARYAIDLVYQKKYAMNGILGAKLPFTYEHRLSAGYIRDGFIDVDLKDVQWDKLTDEQVDTLLGYNKGAFRVKYMAQAIQSLYQYLDYEKMRFLDFSVVGEGSAGLYSNGGTQFIARFGPRLTTQLGRWKQELGYYLSGYSDNTPFLLYDKYRYGKSNVYLREILRVNRYLTLAWLTSLNLSKDSWDGKQLQENVFAIGLGPDDIKVTLGYDTKRRYTFLGLNINMDAKGTNIDYEKMEIKNPKLLGKKKPKPVTQLQYVKTRTSDMKPVLTNAVVTDITDKDLRMENEPL